MRDVLVGILGFVIICAVWYFAWRVIFVFMHVGTHDPFGLLCLILAIVVPIQLLRLAWDAYKKRTKNSN
jgi:hypothetical protein